jgi:hypothetical protein
LKDASLLLVKVRHWKGQMQGKANLEGINLKEEWARDRTSLMELLNHSIKVREAAMQDLFGTPWEPFSSADDQEGEILVRLEAMLQKFIADEAKE